MQTMSVIMVADKASEIFSMAACRAIPNCCQWPCPGCDVLLHCPPSTWMETIGQSRQPWCLQCARRIHPQALVQLNLHSPIERKLIKAQAEYN